MKNQNESERTAFPVRFHELSQGENSHLELINSVGEHTKNEQDMQSFHFRFDSSLPINTITALREP